MRQTEGMRGSDHVDTLLNGSLHNFLCCLCSLELHGGLTGMVCSSYIVKHLLKPPLQGVCLSAFACVWHLHDHYCRPSIWIEPTARWRFTTSYEKAQWLDICLYGSAGQKEEGPRTNEPSGGLQRAGTAAASAWSVSGPEQDFRGRGVLPVRHHREPERHTSTQDPPPGSIKSSLHGEAAPSLLNIG